MKNKIDYTLYLCTDRDLMSTDTIEESVEQAVKGGCTVVQLREKNCSSKEFYELAVRVKEITDRYHVPLIINDQGHMISVGYFLHPDRQLIKLLGTAILLPKLYYGTSAFYGLFHGLFNGIGTH